jgi:acyl-CoA synthetase (AMP-forming)/AMP-acid ligase II/acyl carrier protein
VAKRFHETLHEMIFDGGQDAEAIALLGVDGETVSYGRLRSQMATLVLDLECEGLRRGERVALVMPNGTRMAVALISLMSGFTCAPVDLNLGKLELERRLAEMKVGCIISEAGADAQVDLIAKTLGIESIQLEGDQQGGFNLRGGDGRGEFDVAWGGRDDLALLLQTSGTTSKPKLVGLKGVNVAHSVETIKELLALTAEDRCLSMMPFFHVHGQIMLFASLAAGGSVVCTPGYDPGRFLAWLSVLMPTWYSAVPTIHRAICDLPRPEVARAKGRIRLIRSASSALPTRLIGELEDTFGVPVIEAYGMTEASHGIASNPLPPSMRKAGSVGLPLKGVEVHVIGKKGEAIGEEGEIIIRGKSVISEYLESPEDNARSFVGGWLKTGDLGYIDRDGYIFLTGRIKDLINRGGEKVAPREVEEALLANRAVSEAIAFPVPHPTLGEDVAAAVVLKEGFLADEGGIRAGASAALARHKVPSRVFIVDEIPETSTGKPDRRGMWERVRTLLGAAGPLQPPFETDTERKIFEIWKEVLRRENIGRDERFLEAGGDSLRATQVASRLNMEYRLKLGTGAVLESETIAEQAKLVESRLSREGAAEKKDR